MAIIPVSTIFSRFAVPLIPLTRKWTGLSSLPDCLDDDRVLNLNRSVQDHIVERRQKLIDLLGHIDELDSHRHMRGANLPIRGMDGANATSQHGVCQIALKVTVHFLCPLYWSKGNEFQ